MARKSKQSGKPEQKKRESSASPQIGYTAEAIQVLQGLEPVRKRPGMYIGSTGIEGLHHLVYEVVDNSIDEAMAGHATRVEVVLLPKNQVEVSDNGRGIPVETHKQTKKSALETVMTMLHAGGKFGNHAYKVSGGLHGVGVSVVNALSVYLRAEVCRDGEKFSQEYQRGKPLGGVKKIGKCKVSGTTVVFEPDPEIFKEIKFDFKKIKGHLRDQAYLTAGVHVQLIDRRDKIERSYGFCFEGGVESFVKFLSEGDKPIQKNIFYAKQDIEGILVESGVLYTESNEIEEYAFANNIRNPEGGMHLTGFRSALTRVLNDYARKEGYLKEKDENLTGDDVRSGLVAVISVKLQNPQFEGQTKAKLGNPEARSSVEAVISEKFYEFLEVHKDDARQILQKCLLAAQARRAAKAAKESVLRKGAFEGFTLPGKLADCSSKDPSESEIFIVEGDSAGGSAKQGRDRNFQAILPLKGKILNVEKATIEKILGYQGIKDLIVALGAGFGESFDTEQLRYHKVVLMTDADVDGSHIRTLLLTLFYRYLRPVIDRGFLYIAQPPLYKIQKGKEMRYAYSEDEKNKILVSFGISSKNETKPSAKEKKEGGREITKGKIKIVLPDEEPPEKEPEAVDEARSVKAVKVEVQRYKGLGEMNPQELWETTMDPAKRMLKRVTVEDAKEADRIIDILMGSEVEPRRNFIEAYAKSVKNLDI